jgi:predicted DNA-binding protein
VSVRIPPELARRLDRLVPKLAKNQALTTLGIITKSSVVKLALLRGVEALEAEYSTKG